MFDLNKLVTLGGQGKRDEAFQTFGYITADSKASLLTSGYFNELKGKVSINDTVYVQDTVLDTYYYLTVSSIDLTGTVEVVELATEAVLGEQDYIDFKQDVIPAPTYKEGRIYWNDGEYTLNIDTGLGDTTIQVGQETLFLFYNDSGSTIANGKVLHPVGGTMVGDVIVPTVELAKADKYETCQGTLTVSTMEVLNGELGFATKFGKVRGIDTSTLGAGAQIWVSDTVAGEFVNNQPQFPSYVLSMGGTLNSSATEGELFINQTSDVDDTINNAWDGAIRETFDFRVASDGADITGTISNPNATHDDLTLIYSTGFHTFDAPLNGDITLTAGTDTNPQANYIYIPESTKVLTVSTSEFPEDIEHCRVAYVLLRSASATQTDDALVNQNWNDHIKKDTNNGHILHIAERLRKEPAKWDSGVLGSCSVSGSPSEVYISNTSGKVFQLHKQSFPALDSSTGAVIHIINDSINPYKELTDLSGQIIDANGDALSNRSFSFVMWGVQNKGGETSHIMINLPTGSYLKNTPDNAVNDADNYSVYDIPAKFESVGFLIARFTYILASNGVDWTLYDTQDLRGFQPSNAAGGASGGGGVSEFTALTDTPSSYTGQTGKVAVVNTGETALEFEEATVETDSTLTGTGTVASPLSVAATETTLWSGSAGTGTTVSLSDSMLNYSKIWFKAGSTANIDSEALNKTFRDYLLADNTRLYTCSNTGNATVSERVLVSLQSNTSVKVDFTEGGKTLLEIVGEV